MQSIWIALLGVVLVCASSQAVPVNVTQANYEAETRIIIPPELPPYHFEVLKERSENQANCSKDKIDADSTPLNFLRAREDAVQNITTTSQQPIVAFEGNKQIPIYITIPIYVTTGYQAPPAIGIDNGAVIAAPAYSRLPEIEEQRAMTSTEVKKAFQELFREEYRLRNEGRNIRSKTSVRRLKPYRIYRD